MKEYEVLANDSVTKDGAYQMIYTNKYGSKIIETGQYAKGREAGAWRYMNHSGQVEMEYSFEYGQPIYILPHEGYTYDQKNYPSIFFGSPIIPYYFILHNVKYPSAETKNKKGGIVTLTIKVDSEGRMTGYKIKNASTPNFADAVRKAAAKIPRDKWRWVPALKGDKNVASEYEIIIDFNR